MSNPPIKGVPERRVLVLSHWEDEHEPAQVVGVFSSMAEVGQFICRFEYYDVDDPTHKLGFQPSGDEDGADPDAIATSRIVIDRGDEEELEETCFFVWDSDKKREAYAPLKLYWCTTDDGDEDWFMIAHSAREAEQQYASEEGYDLGDAAAEFVMLLPPELQAKGDEIVGWPTRDMLVACGAVFLREKTPRMVKIGEREFTEGLLDHTIQQIRAGNLPTEN